MKKFRHMRTTKAKRDMQKHTRPAKPTKADAKMRKGQVGANRGKN